LIVILAMRTKERRFERFITDYFTWINECIQINDCCPRERRSVRNS